MIIKKDKITNMTKTEKIEKIKELKIKKDAVILAHYYVSDEVQEIADYIGDSYFLSKKATELTNKTIVFAGVSFMGESAKLLNSEKTVLMPDMTADCPMAHMVTKEVIDKARAEYDDLSVVCYINSTAEIKSWSDVCVTSANAVKIVKNLPNKHILFIPDKNLGHYVAKMVPEKEFVFNDGYCPRHEFMKADEVKEFMSEHPGVKVLAHPECNSEILELADYIGSTTGIINYSRDSEDKEFIICTVMGVNYELKRLRPDAKFYFTKTPPVCVNMMKNSLEKIIDVLENGKNEMELPEEEIGEKAKLTLDRMLELAAR